MNQIIWTLPVPSTSLLGIGPAMSDCGKRQLEIEFSYETSNDQKCVTRLIFEGVESYRVTFYQARSDAMRVAYDRVVEWHPSGWRDEIEKELSCAESKIADVRHFMVNFDDGPCYEFICNRFTVEESTE